MAGYRRRSLVVGGQRLDQFDDLAAHLHIGNLEEGAVELQPLGAGNQIQTEAGGSIFGEALACAFLVGKILEKKRTPAR